jgi:hypothetical protein
MMYLLMTFALCALVGADEACVFPKPLFLGTVVERQPVESIQIHHTGYGVDMGAYELLYDEAVREGDLTLNGVIAADDHLWFAKLCMIGPGEPTPTEVRRVADDEMVPAACWLADLDWDDDVDLRDYARLQTIEFGR